MRGGKRLGAGRKPVPKYLKRNKLDCFRVPQWIIDWIMEQPGSGGRIIEDAVLRIIPRAERRKIEKSHTV